MFSRVVLTAAPVEVALRPVLAIELVAWLRTASLAIRTAVLAAVPAGAGRDSDVTVLAGALVDWVPLTGPPAVLMYSWFSVSGLSQYCGATSMTTWYWLRSV